MSRAERPAGTGLSSVGADRFDASAAVGGWRGVVESAVPTLVFVVIMAVRPTALVPALVASLAVSAVALVARLAQRQGLTQVLGGAVLALLSAAWAWRSGRASNFYATGLVINAVWLVACLGSVAARWPLVGVLMGLWEASAGETGQSDGGDDASSAPTGPPSWTAWRTAGSGTTATRRTSVSSPLTPWPTLTASRWRASSAPRSYRPRPLAERGRLRASLTQDRVRR